MWPVLTSGGSRPSKPSSSRGSLKVRRKESGAAAISVSVTFGKSGTLVPRNWPTHLPPFSSRMNRIVRLLCGIDIFQVPAGPSAARAGPDASTREPASTADSERIMEGKSFRVGMSRLVVGASAQPIGISIHPPDRPSNLRDCVVTGEQHRVMQDHGAMVRGLCLGEIASGPVATGGAADVGGAEAGIQSDPLGAHGAGETIALNTGDTGIVLVT